MNSKDKPMIAAQTAQETEQAKAVRDEALNDEELDTVAGGGQFDPGEWHDGDPIVCSDKGGRHEGGGASGFFYTPYLSCPKCGGAITAAIAHDCPAKKFGHR